MTMTKHSYWRQSSLSLLNPLLPKIWCLKEGNTTLGILEKRGNLWYGRVSPNSEPHLSPKSSLQDAMRQVESFLKDRDSVLKG